MQKQKKKERKDVVNLKETLVVADSIPININRRTITVTVTTNKRKDN